MLVAKDIYKIIISPVRGNIGEKREAKNERRKENIGSPLSIEFLDPFFNFGKIRIYIKNQ